MSKRFLLLGLSGLLLSSCGSNESATVPESTGWTSLRFHQFESPTSASGIDLWVDSDGAVTLRSADSRSADSRSAGRRSTDVATPSGPEREDAAFTRGLLAGERLETIARLVAHLPARPHRAGEPNSAGTYFISIVDASGERTHLSFSGDTTSPVELTELRASLVSLLDQLREPRVQDLAVRIALHGEQSRVSEPRRVILQNRDALLAEARRSLDLESATLPRVDFSREMIVACYLGSAPSGSRIEIAAIERTTEGWLRLTVRETRPSVACSPAVVTPFVWVVLPRQDGDLLFADRLDSSGACR